MNFGDADRRGYRADILDARLTEDLVGELTGHPDFVWDAQHKSHVVGRNYPLAVSDFWKPDGDDRTKSVGQLYARTLNSYFNVSKSLNRTTPYRLTYPLNYHHRFRVHLPDSWPSANKHEQINTPYYQYSYAVRYLQEGKELEIDSDYETLADHVPAGWEVVIRSTQPVATPAPVRELRRAA